MWNRISNTNIVEGKFLFNKCSEVWGSNTSTEDEESW